ncbi:ABC transporter ATP-binding protein [Endozoicomonas sp. SM1973]|uniref:ABC transporter ATP-binding protein n=1 Tax=Spartinivicinus marinus TaxID=2994442 RepID=A0A853I404_9GAMM|nr:ABC transporter ATP-binding protein [Spartinivicinus marinus]MCX4026218.1 ABC transporter ATP-binding protein [Spartinivicinus marinus]NYZ67369.1 ABC transporter ATP-binding protein [Spartinivicinus marinus]
MFAYFEQMIKAFPEREPQQPPNSLLMFCLHYTQGMWKPILLVSFFTALIAAVEAAMLGLVGTLVDWLDKSNPVTFFAEEKTLIIICSIIILVVIPIVLLVHSLLVHQTLLANYPMSIRWLAHRYLLKQSLSFYQNDFAGRIATKVMQTALSIREAMMKIVDVMVYITIYFITMLVLLGQADKRLIIPIFIWLCIYITILYFFIPQLRHLSSQQANARSIMTGRIVDCYANIQTVKLFAHTKREANYTQDSMDILLTTVHKQLRLITGLNTCLNLTNYTLVFSIGALSIYLWSINEITSGAIAAAIALTLRLNGMSHWIMWEISALFENIGTIVDGMDTLSQPQSVLDHDQAKPLQVSNGSIEFINVSFHYGKKSGVIENLYLSIKPGEKVGLVGCSGSGKSTLVNLLLRFYDVAQGEIKIDGQNIVKIQQESLRASIGVVTQDTMLLHRSVKENILYGKPNASEQELITACKKAEAYDFIQKLTDSNGNKGFEAQVGERGVKLSGGQRQRIAIARMLLKNAPILVLDEATSALDSGVEAVIQDNLYKLMEGKTVIAIAHRLSTIAAMDRLIVMDQGKLVEQGSHQDLLSAGGIYAQLWAHQTGGFLGGK